MTAHQVTGRNSEHYGGFDRISRFGAADDPAARSSYGAAACGRYLATCEDVQAAFVTCEAFAGSPRRAELWDQWVKHTTLIEALVGRTPRVWMAGSFISAKQDPRDIDVFYGIEPAAYDSLDEDDLADLERLCERGACIKHFDLTIDAYFTRLPDPLPVDDLRPARMGQHNLQAFQSLGLYDEIWQRARLAAPSGGPGAAGREPARRGYLEVTP